MQNLQSQFSQSQKSHNSRTLCNLNFKGENFITQLPLSNMYEWIAHLCLLQKCLLVLKIEMFLWIFADNRHFDIPKIHIFWEGQTSFKQSPNLDLTDQNSCSDLKLEQLLFLRHLRSSFSVLNFGVVPFNTWFISSWEENNSSL